MSNSAHPHEGGEKAPPGLDVGVCTEKDRADQVALFQASFGGDGAAPVLRWRYDQCPHGRPVTLLGKAQGEAVTGYACNPRLIGWQDGGVTIGQTGDVMTLIAARGKGYFSALDRKAMQATADVGWPVVFGLPNRLSAPLFLEKLGWTGVGRLRPWTLVCQADAAARAERLRAGRLAAWLTGWARFQGQRKLGALKQLTDGFTTEPIERFEDWVEGPAREVSSRYPWMVRRDADYLNWRFFEGPNGRFSAYKIVGPHGEPAGFVVVQAPLADSSLGYLVDLVAPDPGAHAAGILCAVDNLKEGGASVVRAHAIEGSDWQTQLVAAGFQAPKPEDEKWVIAYVHQSDHPLAKIAMDAKCWFFTDADRDDELVR
ncbi:MAG: hypothetical protein ACI89E_000577 [Planctomycetota bacterium]|jgi:hypothetical protein